MAIKRIVRDRQLTDEEAERYRKIREQIANELPDIRKRAKSAKLNCRKIQQCRTRLACLLAAGILFGALCSAVFADSWGPPETKHRSNDRQYALQVSWPGGQTLTLVKTTPAGGSEKLWSRSYVDETWPPHIAYVANDGQHVVLRDVYHNLGYEKVLVFLGPKGEIVQSYELAELLTQDQISRCCHTISSIWWSEPGWFSLLDDKQFAFVTHFGEMQCFDVATGNRIVLDEKGRAEIRAKALNDILPQLKSTGASEQVHAIRLCSALKAAEAIPDLKALMNDDSVQVPAAEALISITKTEAIPLIEPQLATANAATRDGLLNAIADLDGGLYRVTQMPDSPFLLETWRRLSRSQIAGVRSFAVKAVLTRDRSQYVHDHPELLKDPDQEFRYLAVRCLAERGDNRAIPLLRTAFQDGDSSVRAWALRGLAKYHPADILDILHRALQDEDRPIRFDAMLELAERGDKEAIGSLVQRIADLKDHKHDREGWCPGEMRVVGMCELVADLKLSAAEPALREAYTNKCEEIRRPVCGALAALGDRDALGQLHQFARSGEALDRASSIRMLALVRNRASLPVLQEALHDREPWVREAAEEAIARINHKSQTPPKSP